MNNNNNNKNMTNSETQDKSINNDTLITNTDTSRMTDNTTSSASTKPPFQPRLSNKMSSVRRQPRKKLSFLRSSAGLTQLDPKQLPQSTINDNTSTAFHPSRNASTASQAAPAHPPHRHESRGEQQLVPTLLQKKTTSPIPGRAFSAKLSFKPGKNRHVGFPILRSLSPAVSSVNSAPGSSATVAPLPAKMMAPPSTTFEFLQLFERQHPEEPTASILAEQVKLTQEAFVFLEKNLPHMKIRPLARKMVQLPGCAMSVLSELQIKLTATAEAETKHDQLKRDASKKTTTKTTTPKEDQMKERRTRFYHTVAVKLTAMVEACKTLYENMDPYLLQASGEFVAHQQQELLMNPLDAVRAILDILSTDYRSHASQVQALHRAVQFTKQTKLDDFKKSLERIVWMVCMSDLTAELLRTLPTAFDPRKQRVYARIGSEDMEHFTPMKEEACYLADRALCEIIEPRRGGEVEKVLFRADTAANVSIEEALVADLMDLTLEEAKTLKDMYEKLMADQETLSQKMLHSSLRSLGRSTFPSRRKPSQSSKAGETEQLQRKDIATRSTSTGTITSISENGDSMATAPKSKDVMVKEIVFSPENNEIDVSDKSEKNNDKMIPGSMEVMGLSDQGVTENLHEVIAPINSNMNDAMKMRKLYPKTNDIVFDLMPMESKNPEKDTTSNTSTPVDGSCIPSKECKEKVMEQEERIKQLEEENRMLISNSLAGSQDLVTTLRKELLRIKEEASRKEAWWMDQIGSLDKKLAELSASNQKQA